MVDRNPLLHYLKVQERWEAKMLIILRQTAEQLDRNIKKLAGRGNVGSVMRRSQLMQARREIHLEMARLWEIVGSNVEAGRARAAAAAIDAAYEQSVILQNVPYMTPERLKNIQIAAEATAKQGLTTSLQRLQGASYRTLAESVYGTQNLVSGRIDRIVNTALTRGLSARELAAEVRAFINPSVRGGASYAAMRLGRTELNNAFHATQVRYGARTPWVTGMIWNLSDSHPRPDECNDYAGREFEPHDVPTKPHPQCLCYTTYKTMTLRQVMSDPASQRHIDALMRDAGYSPAEIMAGKAS